MDRKAETPGAVGRDSVGGAGGYIDHGQIRELVCNGSFLFRAEGEHPDRGEGGDVEGRPVELVAGTGFDGADDPAVFHGVNNVRRGTSDIIGHEPDRKSTRM